MRIAMIGSGYVGLVSGACLADFGHDVTCVDSDPNKIARLRNGEIPIFEPGLAQLVERNVAAGRLHFAGDPSDAVAAAEIVFIGVGTPERHNDGRADISAVHAAARQIAASVRGFTVVVTKSTVPVGTGDEIERIIGEVNPLADVAVASNPEFLREGAAIEDFKHPDRIVVGIEDPRAKAVLEDVYRPLCLNQAPMLFTRRRTAELIKYAANAFLAMKITFINEVSDLCEVVGADVQEVARGIGLDRRIGPKFLHAGPGYGGSCFPKDTSALALLAQDHRRPLRLVETTIAVNQARQVGMAERIIEAAGGSVRDKTIGLLGLAFKPNTDDVRASPAIAIARTLLHAGARLRAFDPEGMAAMATMLPEIDYVDSAYAAAEGASALVIITEWDSFRALDLAGIRRAMAEPVLVDLRNIYDAPTVERAGLAYVGLGRAAPPLDVPLAEAAE